jgi:hypothetical protein
MFHRVNRTSRYPRGWFGAVGQAALPCKVLFHVCETDSPTGTSNSSLQSVSGTVLELVMMKRAMKPVCHACDTDNDAVAAAARATGVMATPRMATTNADTVM